METLNGGLWYIDSIIPMMCGVCSFFLVLGIVYRNENDQMLFPNLVVLRVFRFVLTHL